jgi:transcriptional regulator with XRE-family HTH domain
MPDTMPKPKKYPQQELASRLRAAMEEAEITQAELARACGVTIQSVHGWREDGRIAKHHLWTICRLTGKSLEYFLLGLGRAAIVAFFSLSFIFIAQQTDASVVPRFDINTHCRRLLRRLWRTVVRSSLQVRTAA